MEELPDSRSNAENKMQAQFTKSTAAALGYALCTLSLEEWNASKLSLLRAILQPVLKGVEQSERFNVAKPLLAAFLTANAANESLKIPSGKEAVIGENGQVTVSHHSKEGWIDEILSKVSGDGITLMEDWQDIADQIESEFTEIEDMKTFFIHARINGVDPETFLASFE